MAAASARRSGITRSSGGGRVLNTAPIRRAGPLTLVLGGVGSGKSTHAEAIAQAARRPGDGPAVYVATAEAGDGEMAARIERHRARRGSGWTTVEESLDLTGVIGRLDDPEVPILIECLSLWLANLMAAGRGPAGETRDLLAALAERPGAAVLVSNEVGLGGVPANALARRFADAAGAMNQTVAAAADQVILVAAGLPMTLKNQPVPDTRTRTA